ncbi:Asp-tRNA(Asn)/Glu-tRNA(Gln) amidotransferase subunit GatB [Candidatus Daviesbacteria bacterium]|nr:Asp-tRNA(Asn)/Glu-tRNA(Gln) amidotransferase subunit GatB [Candidatus Daviesbacteria bacterium]
MSKYEPVIGLEVHVELNTKSKMFCGCSTDYFGAEPNSHTCPVCLGLPGATPFINQQAIDDCIKIGLALGCKVINNPSLFERKNYFYPDLPKGYQISQYRWPLCVNGEIEIKGGDGKKIIRINRAHQEEDTGKLTHSGAETLIDFNRSGVPLVEIVTEPDFTDSGEVRDYAKKLQQVFRYLGVSNADMERGDMRLEANISVRPVGQTELPGYRIELKNINSFRFMVAAIEYEIKRQIEALEKGEQMRQETRGWNEAKKETFIQRVKEEANDYRYFPEPDLPQLEVSEERIDQIRSEIPQMPWELAKKFIDEYGIAEADATILTGSQKLARFFEQTIKSGQKQQITPKQVANFLINKKVDPGFIQPDQVIKEILGQKSGVITDEAEIKRLAQEAVNENPKIVGDYQKGKESAVMALVGVVMGKAGGKADAQMVKTILVKLLS